MKLFISYSRDDKAWVYELWRHLRDELHHDVWIDRRLVPAVDWWGTICENIETCDCFIYVMTPKAVESIYCSGELDYAVALNKPILPLMLKQADYPNSLIAKRVQYQTITDEMNMDKVLLQIMQGLMTIQNQSYEMPDIPRPNVPTPQKHPNHIYEVFAMAEEAVAENNITLAEQFFGQVIDTDPDGLGVAAKERLSEIIKEQDRDKAYANILRLAENNMIKGAKAAFRVFQKQYPNYDPNELDKKLNINNTIVHTPTLNIPSPDKMTQLPDWVTDSTKRENSKPSSLDLMPKPFEWIEIPGKGYSIAKYPITNTQFAKFVEAGGYDEQKWWTKIGWQVLQERRWTQPRYWGDKKWNGFDYPVVGVTWYEAVAFCLWLSETSEESILLPTSEQWQYAAQGDDEKRLFPWGRRWNKKKCNNSGNGTTPVTEFEGKGDSVFGVVDMAGNVWEWCLTGYESKSNELNGTEARTMRGGSWDKGKIDFFRCDYVNSYDPSNSIDLVGFRIVRNE